MVNVNWRNQLLLALALFVLGSGVYWLEFRHKPEKESKEEQVKKLFQVKDTPVIKVRISSGKRAFELRCSDSTQKLCKPGDNAKWEIAEPSKLKADDTNVNSLVSTLNNLTTTDTISLAEDTEVKRQALLKEYGLDPAALDAASARVLSVETPNERTSLFLGTNHPINDGFYAVRSVQKIDDMEKPSKAVNQKQVFLVPSYFKANFERELTYWRDKKLLTVSSHEVGSFLLESQKAGKVAGSRKDNQWMLQAGKQSYPGDIENIDSLLSAAAQLSAKDFASDDKASPGGKSVLNGAKKILALELVKKAEGSESSAPIILSMYRKPKGEKLFAVVSNLDPVFELEPAAFNRLDKELKDLRLVKLISSLERFTAKRLQFSGAPMGDKPLLLTQVDGKWKLQSDKEVKEIDDEKVQRFLDRITGNRIKQFLSDNAVPKGEKDGVTLTLGDEKTDVKRQFLYWKANGNLYARDLLSGRKNEAFLIDSALLEELPWTRGFFDKGAAGAPAEPAQPAHSDTHRN